MGGPDLAACAVVGIFAGYGALCALWQAVSLVRRLPLRERAAVPVSLLIFVRDQEQLIEGFLRTIAGQTRGACEEVVVVDTGSSDDTPAIVERLGRRLGGIRLVRAPGMPTSVLPQGWAAVAVDLEGPVAVRPVLIRLRRLLGEHNGRPHRPLTSTPDS